MAKIFLLSIVIINCFTTSTYGFSIVYNMRIAAITRRQQFDSSGAHPHIVSETAFGQWRAHNDGSKQADAGGLSTYIYAKPSYYLKIDGAIGHITTTTTQVHVARTQLDDLLTTVGYGHAIGKRGRMAYSALLGIPLHRDFTLEISQFGIGHVGLGGQLDGSYEYSENNTIFTAIRCIHFLPRTAEIKNPCLIPLYPCSSYNVKFGNFADLFISHQTKWNRYNRFEMGYDATILFGGSIEPNIPNFPGTETLVRHSFFGVYFRNMVINKLMTGIIVGLSGGFDSKPKLLGARYHLTTWFSTGILF